MKKYDVLGLGCATLDELLFIEEFPVPDAKTRVLSSEKQGGGLTATALVAGARLGAKCAYAAQLGLDDISKFVAQTLEHEGIDTSLVSWREEASAIRSVIIVDRKNATRNIFFERSGEVGAAPDAPDESEIAAAKVLLIDHYGGAGNTRAAQIARRNKVPIVADFERADVPDFEQFLPLVDHLIVSLDFAAQLTNQTAPEAILRALWNENRQVVAVTCGENGVWTLENDEIRYFAAFPTEVVDTTGCGDVFHGIYSAALAWEWPLERRVRWSCAAATLKARQVGAQKGIPTRAEVEAFLDEPSR